MADAYGNLRAHLHELSFDVWRVSPSQMKQLLLDMFEDLGLLQVLRMEKSSISRFLDKVEQCYQTNPFHNFRHAFCVTQMMYVMVRELDLMNNFTPLDVAALLIACISHDLDHPGLNNAYQINAKTDLALKFRNQSPLENHHAEIAMKIIDSAQINLFCNLSHHKQTEMKKSIVHLVLATDMSRHREILHRFETIVDSFDSSNQEHRFITMNMLIKACDVSNECRPLEISAKWVDCLLDEYFSQSDLEKTRGLPYAPHMDRDSVTKAGSQVGFIRGILIPMFQVLSKIFPRFEAVLLPNLRGALAYYQTLEH